MPRLGQSAVEDIYKSVLRFLGPLSLEETYKRIVDEAVRLTRGEFGFLILSKDGKFVRVYPSAYEDDGSSQVSENFIIQAFIERKSIIANYSSKKAVIRSRLYIPFSYRNKPIGVLVVNEIGRAHV